MKEQQKELIIEMMKDFIKFGYGYNSFINMDYPICKHFNNNELTSMWKIAFNKMCRF